MIQRNVQELNSFIRVDKLSDLTNKIFHLEVGNDIFVMENLTFYKIVSANENLENQEYIGINENIKARKIIILGDDSAISEKLENLKAKTEIELSKKENNINKKTGFNLDKSNEDELDDENKLATSKAVNNVKKFAKNIKQTLDSLSFRWNDILEKPNFIHTTNSESKNDFASPFSVKTTFDKALDIENKLATFKTKTDENILKLNQDLSKIEWYTIRNKPNFSDSIELNNSLTFASSKAVRDLHEIVNTKEPIIDRKTGFNLDKTDSIAEDNSEKLATAKAVKTLKDTLNSEKVFLQQEINKKENIIERKSGFNLDKSDSLDDLDTNKLATSLSVKKLNDKKLELISEDLNDKNINDLKTPDKAGIYKQVRDANSLASRGYPEEQAGVLEVFPTAYGVMQRYTCYKNGKTYQRGLSENGNFLNWKRIDSQDKINNSQIKNEISIETTTVPSSNCLANTLYGTYYNTQQVAGGYSTDGGKQPPNYVGRGRIRFLMSNEYFNNGDWSYKDWIYMNTYLGGDVPQTTAFGIGKNSGNDLHAYLMRSNNDNTSWQLKEEIWHTGNLKNVTNIDGNYCFKNGSIGITTGWENEVNFTKNGEGVLWINYRTLGNRVTGINFGNGAGGVGTVTMGVLNTLSIVASGNVGVSGNISASGGISASGSINSSSNISASGYVTGSVVYNAVWNDYAEYFPKEEKIKTEPGDIIALDETSDVETYIKATNKHSVIVGVHSDTYAMLIGGKKPNKDEGYEEINKNHFIPIGLSGRVNVKFIGKAKKGMKVVVSEIDGVGREYIEGKDDSFKIIGVLVEENNNEEIKLVKMFIK